MAYNLLLIGCGNMGGALLNGWQTAGLIRQALVVEPKASNPSRSIVSYISTPSEIPAAFTPAMIVLAVKPQALAEVLPAYRRYAGQAPFLSIAAGKTLAFFAGQLGSEAAVIRAMPNLPVTVGQGATVCCANSAATKEHRALAGTLLEAVGSVDWAQEDKIDAVTALSGSGPAYIFYLAEALEKAAIDLGLEPELAARLARQTIVGAAEMLRQSPEPPAALRARVTSKGGTTEAALKILMENDALLSIMRATLQAAAARSRELAD